MATLKDVVIDLADAAKRGVLTDQELKKFLQYLIAAPQMPEDGNLVQTPAAISTIPNSPVTRRVVDDSKQLRRQYLGRGEYGWVNLSRARQLNLLALLELGNPSDRQMRLDHIEKRWKHHFQSRDLETLSGAREPRWRKTCEWDLHFMFREGLVQRARRGVWELTKTGKQQAEALQRKDEVP